MEKSEAEHEGIWKEIWRLRDRMHQMTQEITALGLGIEEIEKLRERSEAQTEQLTRVETNLSHLLELEKGRFARITGVVATVVTVVTFFIQLAFQIFARK